MPRLLSLAGCILMALASFNLKLRGQATDGNLVGTAYDASGGVVQDVELELENVATALKYNAKTDANGQYRFNNVPVGTYTLTATAAGFNQAKLQNLVVALNKTTTANLTLQLAAVTTTVDVVEAPALIDTTTAQIASLYQSREALDLPVTNAALGVLNLSLMSAGVASSGGAGAGEGPSIGGQRPRNNSFNIEGVDNNQKITTGRNVQVPNESVAEVTILQNQFSAEFGHSGGGQFNTVLKGGSNEIHGAVYEYLQNRNLNAVDESSARLGIRSNPRFDQNTLGGAVGGPLKKNKLFYFGNFQYSPTGQAATSASATLAPTAEGYQRLSTTPGVSTANLDVLRQFLGTTPAASRTTRVGGVDIPIGVVPITLPSHQNSYIWLVSADYSISQKDQLRARFVDNRAAGIDPRFSPNLPVFAQSSRTTSKLVSLSEFHSFSANLANELRLAYNRFNEDFPAGNFQFPGLDAFPNITIVSDLNVQLGPWENAPQNNVINSYQVINNLNWTLNKHALKFGVEGRKYIAPSNFIDDQRGDYGYRDLDRFLRDLTPNVTAERTLGGVPYSGNQGNFYWYVNDTFRLRPNLSVNLGVRYEYKGILAGDKLQSLNAVSSVPGVLEFREPRAQKKNFAPRVGLAYSPGSSGSTSIRAGFGVGYDNYFDNLGINSVPPQLQAKVVDDVTASNPNYLRSGGIRLERRPTTLTTAQARALTSAYVPDQRLPYSMQWNVGVQRVLARDYTVEARYVGTRGVRLFTQYRPSVLSPVTATRHLPTFLQRPSQAELDRLPLTVDDLRALPFVKPEFRLAGLTSSGLLVFDNRGNSVYHGLALEASRRFSGGLLFKAAYTWSHNIDDSTAELASTLLSPRRAEDFQNMRAERSSSFLDRRHRLTYTWIWDTPWFQKDSNWFKRNILGNLTFAGTYTAESPQYATVQSALDSNLNRDSAGDRVIVNPNGTRNTGSAATALNNSAGRTVAYLATNPNAQYIVAGAGAFATGGRQTLAMRGINNFDLSLIKRFSISESRKLEFRSAFFNSFNHPQYVPGSINTVQSVRSAATRNHLLPGNALFNDPTRVFRSNARSITLAARYTF